MSRNPDSPGGAPSQGPQRAPVLALDGQCQAGPGSWWAVGLPRLPSPPRAPVCRSPGLGGLGSGQARKRCGNLGWDTALGGSGSLPPGSTAPSGGVRRGFSRLEREGVAVSLTWAPTPGKGRLQSRGPLPTPPSANPGAQAWRSSSFPFCPGSGPLSSRSPASFARPDVAGKASSGAGVLRASGRSSSWRLPVGCHERTPAWNLQQPCHPCRPGGCPSPCHSGSWDYRPVPAPVSQ